MKASKIEWTDHTFNPWIGCTKVSPGCAHCYAEQRDKRHLIEKVDHWGKGAPRLRTSESYWKQPLKWNRFGICDNCGSYVPLDRYGVTQCKSDRNATCQLRRPRVFCASLADWLDDEVPIEWLADLLALILATQNLDWLLLTKRPQNWKERLLLASLYLVDEDGNEDTGAWVSAWITGFQIPQNIWIGTSVEDQKRADERIPQLLQIPAAIRFLSCEPLLGSVIDNSNALFPGDSSMARGWTFGDIDWVIAGGESGHGARPMHPDWARSLRDQCVAAAVPFFFKQWGEWAPQFAAFDYYDFDQEEEFQKGDHTGFERVGKHAAGRLLDGREWSEFPQSSAPFVSSV